jgi:uncharacterized protein YciI
MLEERKDKVERRNRRAEKLEELVAAVYDHRHWLDTVENQRVFGHAGPKPPTPFAKIEAIATVHFPQFVQKISELEDAARGYELWMFKAGQTRTPTTVADTTGHEEAYKPYLAAVRALLSDIREYSKTEFQ